MCAMRCALCEIVTIEHLAMILKASSIHYNTSMSPYNNGRYTIAPCKLCTPHTRYSKHLCFAVVVVVVAAATFAFTASVVIWYGRNVFFHFRLLCTFGICFYSHHFLLVDFMVLVCEMKPPHCTHIHQTPRAPHKHINQIMPSERHIHNYTYSYI